MQPSHLSGLGTAHYEYTGSCPHLVARLYYIFIVVAYLALYYSKIDLTSKERAFTLMWSSGRLQGSACVLFWELEQTAVSESAPSVDFGKFWALVT